MPQLSAPLSAQWPSGSCIAGTFVQVPAEPGIAHDLHVPVQADEQQTPCAQMLVPQSASAVHVAPGGSLPQLFMVHLFPVVQSPSAVQLLRHWPLEPHWKGAHDCGAGVSQTPLPLHDPAVVRVDPVQPGS